MKVKYQNIIFYFFIFLFFSCKSKKENTNSVAVNESTQHSDNSQSSSPVVGLNLGNKAPEIVLKNLKDSVISLSSIKSKLILIDFWASWCGPCRYENPSVVAAYDKFKNKKFKGGNGFTVYSVSLDMSKDKWEAAIIKDKLEWPYHVSDLKMWGSEVVTKYDIKGIPSNVLINENGIIIDRDLRGNALDNALEKLTIAN